MKFRVDRSQFAEAVAWAGRTVPTKPFNPIHAGLRIDATESPSPKLTLSSLDTEVSGRIETPAEIFEPGKALVAGRLLAEIAKTLPNQPVEMSIEGARVHVRSGRSNFELPAMPVADFPQLPAMPDIDGALAGGAFAAAVGRVGVAAWKDAALQHLTGIYVEADGDLITMAATDRYRLALGKVQWEPKRSDFSASALVPARTLTETTKALATADMVHLAFGVPGAGSGVLGIEGMDRRTTTRLLDGDFPNFRNLLPKVSPITARLNTAELIDAIRRVSVVTDKTSAIRMTFSDSELYLEAGTGEDAVGTDTIAVQMQGDPIGQVAYNSGYLLDGLLALGRPVTNMAFTIPNKPVILTGAESMDGDAADDYLYLLMPVRLQS